MLLSLIRQFLGSVLLHQQSLNEDFIVGLDWCGIFGRGEICSEYSSGKISVFN